MDFTFSFFSPVEDELKTEAATETWMTNKLMSLMHANIAQDFSPL